MDGAKTMNRGVMRCLAILLCIGIIVSGCATVPPHLPPPLLSEEARTKLGTIGVVREHALPDFTYRTPTAEGKLVAGLKGAGEGVLAAVAAPGGGCSGAYCGAALLLYLAVAVPLGAVIGGAIGAAGAVSEEEVTEAEAGLKDILTELGIQQRMRDEFLELARAKTSHTLVDVEAAFPPGRIEPETGGGVPYQTLREAGIDSLIRIGVGSLNLSSLTSEKNPSLDFEARANIKVVQTSDGSDLYYNDVWCSGDRHRFTSWAADAGSLFKEELVRCYGNIANQAVDLLFLMKRSPSKEQPEVGPDAPGGGAPTQEIRSVEGGR